ncbi:hypothetical protein KR032_004012 [Drosophila birchii]|nr:hypothetical protein KR032_004012 [Drosophila birchii]
MKLLLCFLLYFTLVKGSVRIRVRNNHCLIHNRYIHESFCRGLPRRNFYVFHRIINECVQVTTNCPRMHKYNEYFSLRDCHNDCWYWMNRWTTTQDPDKVDDDNKKEDEMENDNNDEYGQEE